MNHRRWIAAMALVWIAACGAPPPEPVVAPEAEAGRDETRNIRNTREIGMPGDAIADRVDQALDANQKHAEELQQAEESPP